MGGDGTLLKPDIVDIDDGLGHVGTLVRVASIRGAAVRTRRSNVGLGLQGNTVERDGATERRLLAVKTLTFAFRAEA